MSYILAVPCGSTVYSILLCTVDLFPLERHLAVGGSVACGDNRCCAVGALGNDVARDDLSAVCVKRLDLVVVPVACICAGVGVAELCRGVVQLVLAVLGSTAVHLVLGSALNGCPSQYDLAAGRIVARSDLDGGYLGLYGRLGIFAGLGVDDLAGLGAGRGGLIVCKCSRSHQRQHHHECQQNA